MSALDDLPPDQRPWLSDISLWETATLLEKGRISFSLPFEEWLGAAAHPRTVRIAPISAAIAVEVASLPKSFHQTPLIGDRGNVSRAKVAATEQRQTEIMRARLVEKWVP